MRRTKALVKCNQGRRASLAFENNFTNFEQGSTLDRILPPVNGEFELLGELRGSFVAGANGKRDISSGSRSFSGSRGFNSSRSFGSSRGVSSNRGFSSNDKYIILTNFGSSI
jgi:hypothetical protein